MNVEDARKAIDKVCLYDCYFDLEDEIKILDQFINEVEHLLQHNSIKQTPALFKK